MTPAHFPSVVDVTIANPDSGSATLVSGFTYTADAVSVSMPVANGRQNTTVQIPINLADVSGLVAASATVQFDSAVLQATGAVVGDLTSDWALAVNTSISGQIRVSMASQGILQAEQACWPIWNSMWWANLNPTVR